VKSDGWKSQLTAWVRLVHPRADSGPAELPCVRYCK